MSERRAYLTFAANVTLPGERIDRIENLVGTGFPDTNLCLSGIESWVEIKAPTEPVRPETKLFGSNHKLSQAQMNWFLRQRRAKGLGFVYIETDKHRLLLDGCKFGDVINDKTVLELMQLASWWAKIPTNKESWLSLRDWLAPRG